MSEVIQYRPQNDSTPRVSVIMAVRNGANFVGRAIDSILAQSLRDFEFIIIDDASTDGTADICRQHASRDSRIRLLLNETNLGLAASLNLGIRESKGFYIARMDADDASRRERLALQVQYLDNNPQISICGGSICYHRGGHSTIKRFYPDHALLDAQLLFHAGFSHPAVMMRREQIHKHRLFYDESYATTQDYELWTRMLVSCRGANLSEVLLDYYCHGEQATAEKYDKMMMNCRRIHAVQLRALLPVVSEDDLTLHGRVSIPHDVFTEQELASAEAWLCRLWQANAERGRYDAKALRSVLFDVWRAVCYQSADGGLRVFRVYWTSVLSRRFRISWSSFKLLMRCLLAKA